MGKVPRKYTMAIKTTSINIDENVHTEFKVYCIRKHVPLGEMITSLMAEKMERDV